MGHILEFLQNQVLGNFLLRKRWFFLLVLCFGWVSRLYAYSRGIKIQILGQLTSCFAYILTWWLRNFCMIGPNLERHIFPLKNELNLGLARNLYFTWDFLHDSRQGANFFGPFTVISTNDFWHIVWNIHLICRRCLIFFDSYVNWFLGPYKGSKKVRKMCFETRVRLLDFYKQFFHANFNNFRMRTATTLGTIDRSDRCLSVPAIVNGLSLVNQMEFITVDLLNEDGTPANSPHLVILIIMACFLDFSLNSWESLRN